MQLYSHIRTTEIKQVLTESFNIGSCLSLLDIGCGTGIFLSDLGVKIPDLQLTGIDFSAKMLAEAHQRLAGLGINAKLVNGSAFELPFPANKFDAIISTRFIHQYSDELKIQLLGEIRRCLKPHGTAVVEFYSFVPWLIRYPLTRRTTFKEHFLHCTSRQKLRMLLGSGYRIVPLMIPGSTRLTGIIGIQGCKSVRGVLLRTGTHFLFDQYLAVFGKT